MRRTSIVTFCLLLVCTFANADRMHPISRSPMQPPGGGMPGLPMMSQQSVGGKVISVQGNTIVLAGGITIDASDAVVASDPGGPATISAIAPGVMILAVLKTGDVAANAPLPASFIGITVPADVYLSGPVQAIDVAQKTLTLLGRTIVINDSTVFGGQMQGATQNFAGIFPGELVVVEANASAGALVAREVHLLAPMERQTGMLRGTVKSISDTAWVIAQTGGNDIPVVVNAGTRIFGNPAVGDIVNVMTTVDSSNALIATLIVKESAMTPPGGGPVQMSMRGTVKSISSTLWTIAVDGMMMDRDVPVTVDSSTVISGSPSVGDHVEVVLKMSPQSIVAVSITKI